MPDNGAIIARDTPFVKVLCKFPVYYSEDHMQKRQEKKLDKKELWSYNTTVAMKGLGVMVTRGSPKPLLRVRILQPLRKPAFFRFTPIGCGF